MTPAVLFHTPADCVGIIPAIRGPAGIPVHLAATLAKMEPGSSLGERCEVFTLDSGRNRDIAPELQPCRAGKRVGSDFWGLEGSE